MNLIINNTTNVYRIKKFEKIKNINIFKNYN